jgi:glycosyltransferase involved in cell wall biosynthesis
MAADGRAEWRPRILYLSPRHPVPAWRGDQVRVYNLARALSRHADVSLLSFGPTDAPPVDGVASRTVSPSTAGRLLANLRSPAPRLPGQVRLFLDRAMQRAVAEEVASFAPDVVHATLARMAPYLSHAAGAHRHLDLVDSLALNMAERARASGRLNRAVFGFEARLMDRYERAAVAAADSCSAVSEADRLAAGMSPGTVVPNGVELSTFPYSDPADRPPTMIFFGNLGYFHNVEPARFLVTEVLPRVRRREPGVELRLAGARPAPSLRRASTASGVELVDTPPDLVSELRQSAVAVLPMFSGSGIKNKVLEAFSVGLPVVTNAIGIDGVVGARAGEHFLLAETADEIAAAAARLLAEPASRTALAKAARRLIEERYTWDRQAEAMLALYDL